MTKNKLIILIVLLSLTSLGYFIYLSFKPTPPPPITPPTPPDPSVSGIKLSNYKYSPNFIFPTLPKELNTYQLTPQNTNLTTLATDLANHFNLTQRPNTTQVYLSSDNSEFLYFIPSANKILYQIDSNISPSLYKGNSNPTIDGSIASLFQLQQQISYLKNLTILPNASYFESDGPHYEDASPTSANLIGLALAPIIEGIPVTTNNATAFTAFALFGQQNQLVKLEIFPFNFEASQKLTSHKTISQDQALSKLNAGQGQLFIAATFSEVGNPKSYTNLQIDSAYVTYRFDGKTLQTIPYLQFNISGGTNSYFTVLLPAIDLN